MCVLRVSRPGSVFPKWLDVNFLVETYCGEASKGLADFTCCRDLLNAGKEFVPVQVLLMRGCAGAAKCFLHHLARFNFRNREPTPTGGHLPSVVAARAPKSIEQQFRNTALNSVIVRFPDPQRSIIGD